MPFFDDNPLDRLALQAGDADACLDLGGLTEDQALSKVEALLNDGDQSQTWLITFDPPSADGRETLFLPLGRRLLSARRAGKLRSCLPSADGRGYVIRFVD